MIKLPGIFQVYFRRQGVVHALQQLASMSTEILPSTAVEAGLKDASASLPAPLANQSPEMGAGRSSHEQPLGKKTAASGQSRSDTASPSFPKTKTRRRARDWHNHCGETEAAQARESRGSPPVAAGPDTALATTPKATKNAKTAAGSSSIKTIVVRESRTLLTKYFDADKGVDMADDPHPAFNTLRYTFLEGLHSCLQSCCCFAFLPSVCLADDGQLTLLGCYNS